MRSAAMSNTASFLVRFGFMAALVGDSQPAIAFTGCIALLAAPVSDDFAWRECLIADY